MRNPRDRPVPKNSNRQGIQKQWFHCVASEGAGRLDDIVSKLRRAGENEAGLCGMTSSAGRSSAPTGTFSCWGQAF
jgi:hypothetical protein